MRVFLDSCVGDSSPQNLAECSLPRTVFYRSGDLRILLKMSETTANDNLEEGETENSVEVGTKGQQFQDTGNSLFVDDKENDITTSLSVKELVDEYEKLSQTALASETDREMDSKLTFTIDDGRDRKPVTVSPLIISPGEFLDFTSSSDNSDPRDILTLTNISEKNVIYKTKCTNPGRYEVHPASNIIEPGECVHISIYLHGKTNGTHKDKFLIIFMSVDPDVTSSNINYLFKTTLREDYHEHKLRCKLVTRVGSDSQTMMANPANTMKDMQNGTCCSGTGSQYCLSALAADCKSIESTVVSIQRSLRLLITMTVSLWIILLVIYWQEGLPMNKYTINHCFSPHY